MKEIINVKGKPSLVCAGFTELSADETVQVSGGGALLYPTFRFWKGFYDGFNAGFGSWIQNGFLK